MLVKGATGCIFLASLQQLWGEVMEINMNSTGPLSTSFDTPVTSAGQNACRSPDWLKIYVEYEFQCKYVWTGNEVVLVVQLYICYEYIPKMHTQAKHQVSVPHWTFTTHPASIKRCACV